MPHPIDVLSLLDSKPDGEIHNRSAPNRVYLHRTGLRVIRDEYPDDRAQCVFLRVVEGTERSLCLRMTGDYHLETSVLGGWLLRPQRDEAVWWIPRPPMLRTLDSHTRITAERSADLTGLQLSPTDISLTFDLPEGYGFDWVLWRFSGDTGCWLTELTHSSTLETQPYFTYASHTRFNQPADLYLHLIHGQVYENLWAWPNNLKICDELDAYALYLVQAGLERATGKQLYGLLRRQLVVSVIARQEADGSFRHGEWTDLCESHNRLINGAVQILAAEAERTGDTVLMQSLSRTAGYLARQVDRTYEGAWFLHDSLECSEEGMRHYPFPWLTSSWLGKSPTNLMILNTQLDCILALDRYRQLSSDDQYDDLLKSARAAVHAVLAVRPADWLYKPLMWMINLTLLPQAEQAALPLPLRALKRLTWQYLLPRWHWIKGRLPRFVMPDGYVERSLCQQGFSHRYHGVHLMDFARYRQRFPSPELDEILAGIVAFAELSHITRHWRESPHSRDTLGFWAEGLYRLCLADTRIELRALLARTMLDLHVARLGLPPALLGACAECVPYARQQEPPSPISPALWLANLSHGERQEWLVVNTAQEPVFLNFEKNLSAENTWCDGESGKPVESGRVPPGGWAVAVRMANDPGST